MKKDYMPVVVAELAKYGLTVDDLTKRELREMLQEAEERDNPEECMLILDGYFGHPMHLQNIKAMREFEEMRSHKPSDCAEG